MSQAPYISLLQLPVSNQVAYHPGSTQTLYWSGKDCNLSVLISTCRINHDFGEPTDPSSIPKKGYIFWHPWVGSKRSGRIPRGLVQQCGAVVVQDYPLNCHSGGSSRLVSTFFLGRKCSHVCKGIHWWQINGSLTHCGKDMVTTSSLYPCFLVWGPCTIHMNSSRVSIHGHCFHVNGHKIKQPRWTETWNQCPERGSHPHPTKWPEWSWRSRAIWEYPILITIPVSGDKNLITLKLGIV